MFGRRYLWKGTGDDISLGNVTLGGSPFVALSECGSCGRPSPLRSLLILGVWIVRRWAFGSPCSLSPHL